MGFTGSHHRGRIWGDLRLPSPVRCWNEQVVHLMFLLHCVPAGQAPSRSIALPLVLDRTLCKDYLRALPQGRMPFV